MAKKADLNSGTRGVSLGPIITIVSPGWSGTAELVDADAGGGRATAHSGDQLPEQAFEDAGIDTIAVLELDARPPEPASPVAGDRADQAERELLVVLESSRDDHDYALIDVDPNGVHRWVLPSQREADGRIEFALPSSSATQAKQEGDRRAEVTGAMRIGARIISWLTDGLTGRTAQQIAGEWEARKRPYRLIELNEVGVAQDPDWERLSKGRCLLLVHGTFSTPENAFAGLFKSAEFKHILAHYEGRCLAFGHPSLSASIDDNVAFLAQALAALSAPLDVDIVCHSRGGLVSRAIAAAAVKGELQLKVGKLVMVAAPNRGTPLAKADYWVDFIDRYTNVLVKLPDSVSTIALEGVLCLVKIVGGGALRGLPGLAAMEADGPTLTALRDHDFGATELHALVADFTPAAGTPIAALVHKAGGVAVDAFFNEANDLVVPTDGCFDLKDAKSFPLKEGQVHRFSGSEINHVTFFNFPNVRTTLAQILTAG